jgi:trk system potassium uptake protein TrkH
MRRSSITIIESLMFIGGSPGSTAGGIKTTTLALMVLSVIATLKGRSEVVIWGRTISQRSIVKATAIVFISACAVFAVLLGLLLTQSLSLEAALFEAFSALATVGLSIGATAQLDEVGKVIVIIAMFAGRIGPLTLFLLIGSDLNTENWKYPEEEIHTG